jgi:hypothetical protein
MRQSGIVTVAQTIMQVSDLDGLSITKQFGDITKKVSIKAPLF